MILEYVTTISLIVVLALVIVFLYIRDKEMTRLIISLKNEILELKQKTESNESSKDNSKEYKELDNKIYEIGESLIKIVRNLKSIDAKQNIHEERLAKIEEQLKQFTLSSSSNTNENKIISLYKDGKSIEEIAQIQRLPVGEVELIIKLANLNAE